MDTPQEVQRRMRQDPVGFAKQMEARGRRELNDPRTELFGRLRIDAAQQLREHFAKR